MIVTLIASTVYRHGAEKMMIIARERYFEEHDEYMHDEGKGRTDRHAEGNEQWFLE
jgi:hypothetical protein